MMGSIYSMLGIETVLLARAPGLAWGGAVAGAAVLLTLMLYWRSRGAPLRVRIGLALARLLALLLVLGLLFEPIAVVRRKQSVKRRLPVLIDVSASMAVNDHRKGSADVLDAAVALGMLPPAATNDVRGALASLNSRQIETIGRATRLDLASGILSQSARATLAGLAQDVDIDYYAFDNDVHLLGREGRLAGKALEGLQAAGSGTAILDALSTVVDSGRDAPIAGILLLSDGLDTASRGAEARMMDLSIRNIPVYPVPLGLADPDDVSIRNIVIQEVAFSGDKVPIRVQIHSKGYEKRSVNMTVRLNDRIVSSRQITLAGGLQFEEIFFNVDIHEKGAAQVKIALEAFDDEATVDNNEMVRGVRIVNEKINVLCIEGNARWEYRYLLAMLKRDPRINVKFIASRASEEMALNSEEYIARFPDQREAAFNYDLVILGDVDASFFSSDEMLRLEELVRERGGSLLMLCGKQSSPVSYAGTLIERMLPVTLAQRADWEHVDDAVHPVLTPQGRGSLVMTLEMDAEVNDAIWRRVAPLGSLPPLLAARPGATVLATLSTTANQPDPYPLVAWHRYGTGKTMLIATDRFWLLRFKTGDKYHWRVWSQYIQFLTLSRLLGEHKRIRLETDRASYPVGEQVQLYAQMLDDRYEPVIQAGFEIQMTYLDEQGAQPQSITLQPDAETAGLYEGFFSPPRPGRYRMEANPGDSDLANTAEFQVADVNTEMANTQMYLQGLQRIANLTGGKVLDALQLHQMPDLINRDRHETRVTTQIRLWDNVWTILLLVGLLGMEWIVRRRYDFP